MTTKTHAIESDNDVGKTTHDLSLELIQYKICCVLFLEKLWRSQQLILLHKPVVSVHQVEEQIFLRCDTLALLGPPFRPNFEVQEMMLEIC